MNNNQNKPASVVLDGFAPPAGSGAGTSSSRAESAAVGAGVGETTEHIAAAAPAKNNSAGKAGDPQTRRGPKKRAAASSSIAASAAPSDDVNENLDEENVSRPPSDIGPGFEPLSLPQIQLRLRELLNGDKIPRELPDIPAGYDPATAAAETNAAAYAPIQSFASALQVAIEEYNLLLSLVSSATYKWGVDRSGASQQNLSVMSAELQTCQDVISNVVSARLSNVLCPAVDVLIGEVEVARGATHDDGSNDAGDQENVAQLAKKRKILNEDRLIATASTNERRINHYTRPIVDPSYVHLCHCILARNASLIRHTVATSIHTAQRVIGDYLKAMKKDTGHEAGKGGYY